MPNLEEKMFIRQKPSDFRAIRNRFICLLYEEKVARMTSTSNLS